MTNVCKFFGALGLFLLLMWDPDAPDAEPTRDAQATVSETAERILPATPYEFNGEDGRNFLVRASRNKEVVVIMCREHFLGHMDIYLVSRIKREGAAFFEWLEDYHCKAVELCFD